MLVPDMVMVPPDTAEMYPPPVVPVAEKLPDTPVREIVPLPKLTRYISPPTPALPLARMFSVRWMSILPASVAIKIRPPDRPLASITEVDQLLLFMDASCKVAKPLAALIMI